MRTYGDDARGEIVIEIRDEGAGIPEKNMRFITDPFFTTKRDTGGIGLGLSVSVNIIRTHQGRLEFQSAPGLGTTAVVRLPARTKE